MTFWRLSWTGILFPPVPIQRFAGLWRTSHWTRSAGSLFSTGVYGRVMATMQPTLRQNAGCESLKNDSSGLPELTRITAAAIVLFVLNHRQAVR
jgi:hypothetical protein